MSHLHSHIDKMFVKNAMQDSASHVHEDILLSSKESLLENFITHDGHSQIQEQLNNIDKDRDYYGEGFMGRVYLITLDMGNEKKQLLIVKARRDESNKILNEYNNHLIMQKFHQEHPNSLISMPKIYGLHNDTDGNIYLVMEYIKGMTLYTYKLSRSLPIIYDELLALCPDIKDKLPSRITLANITTDKEAKKYFSILYGYFEKHGINSEFFQTYLYHFEKIKDSTYCEQMQAQIFDDLSRQRPLPSLDSDTIDQFQKAIVSHFDAMNKQGLYHNDVTHRNVILGADGKIYFIDFDKSGKKKEVWKGSNNLKNYDYVPKYHGKYAEGDFKILRYLESLKAK